MPESAAMLDPAFRTAFLANEQQERINTGRVASALVFFLMPAGVTLDFFVYHGQPKILALFLGLRLFCSALAAGLWFLHGTAFGRSHYKLLGLPIALLPAGFISLLIY